MARFANAERQGQSCQPAEGDDDEEGSENCCDGGEVSKCADRRGDYDDAQSAMRASGGFATFVELVGGLSV